MEKKIKLTFENGTETTIDEQVYKLIKDLEYKNLNVDKLPFFWNITKSIRNFDDGLLKFYSYLLSNHMKSKSQLFQDLFVLFYFKEKRKGTFLEFGATDGIEFSNSFILENNFNWRGVLAEPSPQWHEELYNNRPNCKIIKECIYNKTGDKLDFFVSDVGVLSTLENFRQSDISSIPGNTHLRNKKGYNYPFLVKEFNYIILLIFLFMVLLIYNNNIIGITLLNDLLVIDDSTVFIKILVCISFSICALISFDYLKKYRLD